MVHRATEAASAPIGQDAAENASPESRVLAAARLWLVDRAPGDTAEKTLAAAVARAWPGDLGSKEGCPCGDSENCDECPSAADIEALLLKWEKESSDLVPNQFTRSPDFSAAKAKAVSR